MAKEKPGVMMYWNTFDVLEALLDGQAKTMLRAIRNYSQYGEAPDFGEDTILTTLWLLIQPLMDADNERYERIREARIEAGRKGGIQSGKSRQQNKANALEMKQNEANEANASKCKQTKPITIPDTIPNPVSFTESNPDSNPVHEGKRESGPDPQEGKREGACAPVLVGTDMEPEEEQEREQMKRQAMAKLWERIQEDANGQV